MTPRNERDVTYSSITKLNNSFKFDRSCKEKNINTTETNKQKRNNSIEKAEDESILKMLNTNRHC